MSLSGAGSKTWRVSPFALAGAVVIVGIAAAILQTSWAGNVPGGGVFEGSVVAYVLVDSAYTFFLRPRIQADPGGGIVVINPAATYRIPWSEVSRIEASTRVVVQTPNRPVVAWAVQATAINFPDFETRPARVRKQLEAMHPGAAPGARPVQTRVAWQHHVVIGALLLLPAVVHSLV